jgi:hypothetical protein
MKWNTGLSILSVTAVVAGVGGSSLVVADTGFRCKSGRLVDQGDHMFEVRDKCGEPDAISTRVEKRTIKQKVRRTFGGGLSEDVTEEREVEVLLDEWVYDLGDRRFIRYVAFENDRVIDIVTGRRGSLKR